MTYAELDRRANQLAHHLRALGVGPDTLVGLCVERSVEMLVGLLGILKAGGAYLPLDPAYPSDRITFMLEDSGAAVLIVAAKHDERRTTNDEHVLSSFVLRPSSFVNLHVVDLRADWPQIAMQPAEPVVTGATADNLAYVIYTSGSTGRPKGVQIAHRAVANFLGSMRRQPGLDERDTLLSVTTLSFDIAALELFLPLTTGARLALVSRAVAADGVRLAGALARSRATVMQATPATWRALLDAGWAGNPSLTILCGGEALPRELADRLSARSRALWNMYGPTETTIWSAAIPVEQAEGPVPVGHPIAETQLYVLDARMQLMPVGAPGELYIGGAGLARGYLGRPDLTATRFIPNPFVLSEDERRRTNDESEPSSFVLRPSSSNRLYRTGDLVCYRPDGTLAFLGRADQQVKVRGFRIEIGEIEAALRRHPAVREAAVAAREDRPGDARLVAYIVQGSGVRSQESGDPASEILTPDSRSLIPDLRAFLAERLPSYMLPSAFVLLDAFPLTPNGKLDRKALPAPDAARPDLGAAFVAPRSDVERQLARIWEELLNVAPIGVTDDFFALGGHSLVAVRLMAQVKQRLGRDLPLATLFNGATIERLARLIEEPDEQRSPQALVGIQPNGARRPFFAVHPIGGNVLCYADLARALGPDQPLYGLQAAELADVGAREVRIEDMAADYVAAIRALQPEGPYQLGGWSFGGLVAFEMAQQLRAHGQEVGLLALFDTHAATALGQADNLTDAMVLAVLVKEQALANGQALDIALDDLEQLAPQEQLELVLEQVRRANIDFETELAWVQRFLHGYRARERAMLSYRPRLYPGRITLFRSTEQDAEIARIQALAGGDSDDPAYGWGAYSAEPVQVYAVPGYHNTLVLGENAEGVARRLSACFEHVQAV